MVIFRAFLFIFFRPPDPKSEKNSHKSTNKKFWPYHALNYIDHTAHMILVHCKSL